MPQEIERKFLVLNEGYKSEAKGSLYRQGYLSSHSERTVRVRIVEETATLTIKGLSIGAVRPEFEYPIPLEDAVSLLGLCEKPLLEKIRYRVPYKGMLWEVDEFLGENAGLVVAEIELAYESQPFEKPDWLGQEVTSDPRYYNSQLIHRPFKLWLS